ncbi:hypothetical protein [Erythrobacter sp.]|nr:hypothetical protein [Erythrobacter sp.]
MQRAKGLSLRACAIAQQRAEQLATGVVVLACAAALILAGQPVPL